MISLSQELVSSARLRAERGECRQVRRPGGRGRCEVRPGECEKGLASVYHEEVIRVRGEERRLVVTNGIPSHPYHNYTGTGRRQNPNEACRTPVYMVLPLSPTTTINLASDSPVSFSPLIQEC